MFFWKRPGIDLCASFLMTNHTNRRTLIAVKSFGAIITGPVLFHMPFSTYQRI